MAFKQVMFFSSLALTASSVNFPSSQGGNACQLLDGSTSKCALITECPTALQDLKLRRPLTTPRCGFKGRVEIVCCPDLRLTSKKPVISSTTEHNNIRRRSPIKVGTKSAEACQKFTAGAYPRIALFVKNGVEAGLGEFPHMAMLGYPLNKYVRGQGERGCRKGEIY